MGTDQDPESDGVPPGYRILRVVATTNMSVVYQAQREEPPERVVALKVLKPDLADREEFRTRFAREVNNAGKVQHDSVVPIYHAGTWGDLHFVEMQWVDGQNLGELVAERGRLPLAEVVEYARQVAEALAALHRENLVHRDVKPSNIMVRGDGRRVYLCDFGIAKQLDVGTATAQTPLTQSGAFLGSVPYAPPEQIRAETLDARTDEYALACTAYECLTGERPFPGPTTEAMWVAHLRAPRPRASDKVPDLPAAVSDVLVKGMAKEPDDRYPDCVAFASALAAAAAVEVPPRRWRRWVVALAVLVVLLLAIVGWWTFFPIPGGEAAPDGVKASASSASRPAEPSRSPTGTPVHSPRPSSAAADTTPSPTPARSRSTSRPANPPPQSPTRKPGCRQVYVAKTSGDILDASGDRIGRIAKDDYFVQLDTPPGTPSHLLYGQVYDVTGYVRKDILAKQDGVCL